MSDRIAPQSVERPEGSNLAATLWDRNQIQPGSPGRPDNLTRGGSGEPLDFNRHPDIYALGSGFKQSAGGDIPPPSKQELQDLIKNEPNSIDFKGEKISRGDVKKHESDIVNSLTDSELKDLGDFANAMKHNDLSKFDEVTQRYKNNPQRLGEIFGPLSSYLTANKIDLDHGYDIAYGEGQTQGVMSVKVNNEPMHYVRTDGTDPNTKIK